MKIAQVTTYALRAAPIGSTYWGKATWGASDATYQQHPRSLGPVASTSEQDKLWQGRFPALGRMRPSYSATIDTTLVKLTTDDGVEGWGEAKAPVAPEVAKVIIDLLLADTLIGRDPFDVEVIWETLYASMRLRGHASGFMLEAISAVDIALWDLIGKATGKPVHKLLGGAYRERIDVYASGIPSTLAQTDDADWERMLTAADKIKTLGYKGFKVAIGLDADADVRSLTALRNHVGDGFAIYADAAGNYDVPTALRVGRKLQDLDIGFFEAPLPHENFDGYAELASGLDIPIANDVLANRYQVLEYLKRKALHIVQPDVCRAGGITELKRISVLADAFGASFTPHVSIGSAVHVAASLHLAAANPNNAPLMEFWYSDNPLGNGILQAPAIEVIDGKIQVPTGPGLGVNINETKLEPFVTAVNVL